MTDTAAQDATIITYGPRHAATNGAFRLRLHTDGSVIERAEIELGYRHSGAEKVAEDLHSVQLATVLARIDDANPVAVQDTFARTVELLCAVDVPERAQWLRVLLLELERAASHLGSLVQSVRAIALDDAASPLAGAQAAVWQALQYLTGSSRGHDVVRPGGLAVDFTDDALAHLADVLTAVDVTADAFITRVLDSPTFRCAYQDVGRLSLQDAQAFGVSGPAIRATGSTADLRSDRPFLAYGHVPFDVISAGGGDAYGRHAVRAFEVRESVRIVRHVVAHLPSGPVRVANHGMTPPPRSAFADTPGLVVEHVHHYANGFEVPVGDAYVVGEGPRGQLGCYFASDGSAKPQRLHLRSPNLFALQVLPVVLRQARTDDVGAILASFDLAVAEAER